MKNNRSNSNKAAFVFFVQIIPQTVSKKYIGYAVTIIAESIYFIVRQTIAQSNDQIGILDFVNRMPRAFIWLIKNRIYLGINRGYFCLNKFTTVMF